MGSNSTAITGQTQYYYPTAGTDYYLIAKCSGKALAVDGQKTEDGENVLQWTNQLQDSCFLTGFLKIG
ncbi:RICIN domain-containing protein [Nostoc linckia FACHB-391]|uniref:RICIN domain-containing protein n=2 Tax=Nostoc TaxID=1177 RepID=A0ABR8ILM7_9NOSO|nr:RICIN domain-containing protein [Nostoc linckia FACHB-391]MBD2651405.1 RICIN domain-containing protein [Nostoc foliaceum FACHB-393]